MFNVQIINCMQYSKPVVIPWSNSVANKYTQNTKFKNTTISFNWKEGIWSLTKRKGKQERKANRIITLDGENS